MSINLDELKQCIGREETLADWVTPTPLLALSAALDREDPAPEPGDAIPPCWDWLYFLPLYRQSEIGPDGHPRRRGFLPPVDLPRRMWASSRLEWGKPLRVGQAITKTDIHPDPVLLLRYSALSFNGHRIHYDRRYATETESYPGLVVHGPLIATLLLDLLRRHMPDAQVWRFTFRAIRPTFDLDVFRVCGARAEDGKSVRLWAEDSDGALALDATVTFARCPEST